MKKKIMFSAGEPSGDRHAAILARNILASLPDTVVFGMGGDRMRRAGVRIDFGIDGMAVIGLVEVLRKYRFFSERMRAVLDKARAEKPDVLVLVDYPGFNIRLARKIRKILPKTRIVYYIAPQLWAWGRSRARRLRSLVDVLVVILPFEKKFFEEQGFDRVAFCGHPMREYLPLSVPRSQLRTEFSAAPENEFIVTLLPGSRLNEIERMLPVMLEGLIRARDKVPGLKIELGCAGYELRHAIEGICAGFGIPVGIHEERIYELISASDLVLTSSGTATLETGLIGTPMMILYKVSFFTWLIGRFLVRIKNIGLINIVLGRTVCPEYIQFDLTPENIAADVIELYRSPGTLALMRRELGRTRDILGPAGAQEKAAALIAAMLKGK